MSRLVLFASLLVCFVFGCSGNTLTDPSEVGAISSQGGFLRSEDGTVTLEIPPLALDNPVQISLQLAPVEAPPTDRTPLSQAVTVLPEALTFGAQQYAVLTLPLDLNKLASGHTIFDVEVYQRNNNKWEPFSRFSIQEENSAALLLLQKAGTYAVFSGPAKPVQEPLPTEPASEPSTEPTPDGGNEPPPEKQPDTATEPAPDGGNEPSPEIPPEPSPDGGSEPPPERPSEPAPDGGSVDTPPSDQPSEPSPDGGSEPSPEKQPDGSTSEKPSETTPERKEGAPRE